MARGGVNSDNFYSIFQDREEKLRHELRTKHDKACRRKPGGCTNEDKEALYDALDDLRRASEARRQEMYKFYFGEYPSGRMTWEQHHYGI